MLLPFAACRSPLSPHTLHSGGEGPRILVVVAHPDDEITFGATLYKTATFLDGACDIVVITNGEGGYKYSTLAERVYDLELSDEEIGRTHLPAIRRREELRGCDWLGVRRVYFLDQLDHRYTQDPMEVLGEAASVWDTERVRETLSDLMRSEDYDFVFLLAPTEETHGHHQAASILALRAALQLSEEERPALLCARTSASSDPAPTFVGQARFPETRIRSTAPLTFDRLQSFGHLGRLDYRIVVNWAIAEHRSQGTMQLLMNAGDREHYFLFEASPAGSERAARELFDALAQPQFAPADRAAVSGDAD